MKIKDIIDFILKFFRKKIYVILCGDMDHSHICISKLYNFLKGYRYELIPEYIFADTYNYKKFKKYRKGRPLYMHMLPLKNDGYHMHRAIQENHGYFDWVTGSFIVRKGYIYFISKI